MLKIFLYAIVVIACGFVLSCTKVVDVSLRDAASKLVIQANITDNPGKGIVFLNRSVNYTQDNAFPVVSGAQINMTDQTTGVSEDLFESPSDPGSYITGALLWGQPGHTYLLTVTSEGKIYTSVSTMPIPVNLDSVTFQTVSAFGFNITNPLPNFQDPANVQNNYRFVQSINKKLSNNIFVFDDRLSDGKYISRQLFNDSSYIQKGDTIEIEMQCIDKNIYNYFKELSGTDPYNGQPTSPANPTTNIVGGALGYFSAHTSQKKSAVAK